MTDDAKGRSAHDAMAKLCHRLGSPVGALVNHLYLLSLDREELPPAAQAALDGANGATQDLRALLDTARRLLDAETRTLAPRTLGAAEVADALGVDVEGEGAIVADPEALEAIAADLRAHGVASGAGFDSAGLRLEVAWEAPEPAEGGKRPESVDLEPFAASAPAPRWACAAALAARMGGQVEVSTSANGAVCATFSHPAVDPGGS